MKKIILILMLQLTTLIAIDFTITEEGLFPTETTTEPSVLTETTTESSVPTETTTEPSVPTESADGWVETPLPATAFNVLDYGLKGDGSTNDSAALEALAQNTNVTNWYFPANRKFRLYAVNIPSHVVAVYGGGTIVSISRDDGGYEYGGLYTKSAHQDLVIDGLTFVGEAGYIGNQYYGQFQLNSNGDSTDNTQIRNCTFDAALRNANSLRVFARIDPNSGDHTNLRIYNNTFINGKYFAMELFNNTINEYVTDDMEGLRGLRIYDNTISGGSGSWGIGIGRIRTESYTYNNNIDVDGYAIEIIESNNNHAYNNLAGARNGHALSQGVIHVEGVLLTPGVNYVHHNHFYGLKSVIYRGSNSEIYENFFNCYVELEGYTADGHTMLGNFHDNTVVTSSSKPVQIIDMTKGGYFQNNEIYGTTSYTDTYVIRLTNVSTNINILNNKLYNVKSSTCIQAGGTQSGNICNGPYSGEVPTSRPGAGNL